MFKKSAEKKMLLLFNASSHTARKLPHTRYRKEICIHLTEIRIKYRTQKRKAAGLHLVVDAAAVAATDTVVDKLVDSTRRHVGNNSIKGLGGNVIAETFSLLSQTEEVSGKTSDMGRSHRGTGDGVGLAVGPGAEDIGTGSEDINDRAEV